MSPWIQMSLSPSGWLRQERDNDIDYSVWEDLQEIPDSKVHGAIMGPIWGRQDPGGPHVDPMNFVIWDITDTVWGKKQLGS